MAEHRTLITTSLSLQRIEHGEQTVWMAATLAAMLGQIGLPGGFGHGYSSNGVGNPPLACGLPALPQGNNPVSTFIPVAAISELLQRPGQRLAYNGRLLELPDIKCVYWAGGNPFHHHQNLPRLRRALSRVDTIVVHEQYWTAMAKHADIVVPTTTSFERDDFAASKTNPTLIAMPAMVPPYANARDDYHTFSALAHRLGFGKQFTEGRSARVARAHVRQVVGRAGFPGAVIRRILADRPAGTTDQNRFDVACRFPGRPGGPSVGDTQRADRDLLGHGRRVCLAGLCRAPHLV